jgi:hypothetical protein
MGAINVIGVLRLIKKKKTKTGGNYGKTMRDALTKKKKNVSRDYNKKYII